MIITNKTKNTVISSNAEMADSFFSRMRGLLKHESLEDGEGLVITKCNSIHMFFMKFSIDVIFIDKKNRIVGIVENIKPNQLSKIYWKATAAIELPVGVIQNSRSQVSDEISFQ